MQAHNDKINGLAGRRDGNGFLKCETKEIAAISCTYKQAVLGKQPPEHQQTGQVSLPPTILVKGITFPLPEMSEEADVTGLPPGSNMSAYSRPTRLCGAGRSAVERSTLLHRLASMVREAPGARRQRGRSSAPQRGHLQTGGLSQCRGRGARGRGRERAGCPFLAPPPRGEGGSARLQLRPGWQRPVRGSRGSGLCALPRVKPPFLAACGALVTLSDGQSVRRRHAAAMSNEGDEGSGASPL